ncbi:mechanosensitive ion channel family protein, partial [Kitasatospora sp. NPDC058263]
MGWSLVRLIVVAASAAVAAYGLNLLTEAVARLVAARGHTGPTPTLLRACRPPLLAATACGLMLAGEPWART